MKDELEELEVQKELLEDLLDILRSSKIYCIICGRRDGGTIPHSEDICTHVEFRDLLAIPFAFLMFMFASLAIIIGGKFTAEKIKEIYGQ